MEQSPSLKNPTPKLLEVHDSAKLVSYLVILSEEEHWGKIYM